ncbi:hypothetical protein, partial [Pseudomonas sp. AB12(2023)]|uniref:hypothetical protein n=1 Tax=Pseudomonas sp. AB12(2023) TaxID=3048597 RepID=UPI002B238090
SYTGATTLSEGSLVAGAANAFGNNSAVSIASSSAILDLGGFNQAIGSLAGTAGTVTNNGAAAAVLITGGNNASSSFSGLIKDGTA